MVFTFSLYLFTFWQINSIKSMLNQLLAVPVCSLPMDAQTTISGLL